MLTSDPELATKHVRPVNISVKSDFMSRCKTFETIKHAIFLSLVKTNKEIQPHKRHLRELARVPVRAGAGGMDQSLANGLLPSALHYTSDSVEPRTDSRSCLPLLVFTSR